MTPGDLDLMARSWLRSLRSRNLSAATQDTYRAAIEQMLAHLDAAGVHRLADVGREHVEEFMAALLATRSASTANNRYRALQQFYKWAVEEGELEVSPMERMRPPLVPERPVPILTDEALRTLLKTCDGTTFVDRRDNALLRLFIDTGARLAELSALTVGDVDLDTDTVFVLGKGRRPRAVHFGDRTGQAVERYLRQRARHPRADVPGLWLGEKGRGPMTSSGVAQVVGRRGEQAGLVGLHPHQLRHTAAHRWLAEGGSEVGAKEVFGWKSQQMLSRYASSTAGERARAEHKRLGLGDRL